jgi:hypothetical protein
MLDGSWVARSTLVAVAFGLLASCADPEGSSLSGSAGAETDTAVETTGDDSESSDGSDGSDGSDTSETDDETGSEEGSDTGEDDPCEDPLPCPECECVQGEWECECDPMVPEAGYYTIEPIDYTLGLGDAGMDLQSSTARLFYSFQPADELPFEKPLFLIFNGGPAVSSGLLMGTNTGPMTIDPAVAGEDGIVENEASWTTMGNLLYVDPRATGFSYNLMNDPSNDGTREDEFQLRNFNTYLDAADYVRLLLRFLADHPQLQEVPIVIVGESYGGIRAGILLNLLLFHDEYGDGSMRYVDPALVEEIEDHLSLRFPEGDVDDPAVIAEQFRGQVLIQPSIAGLTQENAAGALFELDGSPMQLLADELQVEFLTCADKGPPCDPFDNGLDFIESQGRSIYDYSAADTWLSALFDNLTSGLAQADLLAALLRVELANIEGFEPAERTLEPMGSYRVSSIGYFDTDDEMGNLGTTLGQLEHWDRYFMIWNYEALIEFASNTARSIDVDHYDAHHGENFLRNLLHVETFITSAGHDVIIYGPSIAPTLADYDSLVESAVLEPDLPAESPRPGRIQVSFVDGAFEEAQPGTTRTVRQPIYSQASHSVTLDQPLALRDDVEAWISSLDP